MKNKFFKINSGLFLTAAILGGGSALAHDNSDISNVDATKGNINYKDIPYNVLDKDVLKNKIENSDNAVFQPAERKVKEEYNAEVSKEVEDKNDLAANEKNEEKSSKNKIIDGKESIFDNNKREEKSSPVDFNNTEEKNAEVYNFHNKYIGNIAKKYQNNEEDKNLSLVLQFEKSTEDIFDKIRSINSVNIKYKYNEIFKGASIEIASRYLKKLDSIKNIGVVEESSFFEPKMVHTKDIVNAMKLTGKYSNDGRGMVIAVVDSGMDTKHKDMRLDDGVVPKLKDITPTVEGEYTLKVPHGYNYLGRNNKLIDETEKPHGMHIAGILAANATDEDVANNLGVDGIAPNAQLLMYRVFSDREDSQIAIIDDTVYAAIEDAIKHGADVISLSIGAYGNGKPSDAYYKAVERAKSKGIVVVASMGNASTSGSTTSYDKYSNEEFESEDVATTVSVAANTNVIGVGSTTNSYKEAHNLSIGDQEIYFWPVSYSKFEDKNYEFVDAKAATEEDLKDSDLAGKVAVLMRTDENPKLQFDRVREKGAVGVISYNTNRGRNRDYYKTEIQHILEENVAKDLWGVTVSNNDGLKILELIKNNANMSLKYNGFKTEKQSEKHEISGFSSWGGTVDLELKPDIVAPGEGIYSTFNHDRYGVISGTSMSTPVVAGAAALVLPKLKSIETLHNIVDFTKMMMMNTADPLKDTTGLENSPRQQGAGMLNIQKVLDNDVLVSSGGKAVVTLKEIKEDRISFKVKLENLGNSEEVFNIRLGKVITSGLEKVTKETGEVVKEIHSKEIENSGISTDVTNVTLKPKESKEVEFILNTPKELINKFVEGYIYFDSNTNPGLAIPYFGFKGDWQDAAIIDPPRWEKGSKTKLTSIMSTSSTLTKDKYMPLGLTDISDVNSDINPNNVAISSKLSNRILGSAFVRMTAMRDLVDFEVDVVNEKSATARSLHTIQTAPFLEKFRYVDYFENDYYRGKFSSPEEGVSWSGNIYNSEIGDLAPAEEGQYYIRIKARNDKNKDYQYTYLPIKIDNTLPTANIEKVGEDYFINTSDNYGIMLVKASLDGEELSLEKVADNKFKVLGVESSLSKANKLNVSVADIAGNLVELEEVVGKTLINILNKDDLENSKRVEFLETKISDAVKSVEVYLNDNLLTANSEGDVYKFELGKLKDGNNVIRYVLKDKDNAILLEDSYEFLRDVKAPHVEIDDLEYDEDYEDEDVLKSEDGYVTISGTVTDAVTKPEDIEIYYFTKNNKLNKDKKILVKPDSEGHFSFRAYLSDFPESVELEVVDGSKNKYVQSFATSPEKYEEIEDKPITINLDRNNVFLKEENLDDNLFANEDGTFNYPLKITADSDEYFIKINNGELLSFEDGEIRQNLKLVQGANIIDIEGYDINKKLIMQRRNFFFVDIEFPKYNIDNFNPMPRLENETDVSVTGTLYIPSEEYTMTGYAEDNGLSWSLFINDSIVKRGKAWREFGGNRENFSYKTYLKNNDILKFRLVDYFGNEENGHYSKYRVIIDKENPNIITDVVAVYKKSAKVTVEAADNNGLLNKTFLVDKKHYNSGDVIDSVGEHSYSFSATDYAGNKVSKKGVIKIIDDLNANQIKNILTKEELLDINNWLELSYGTQVKILNVVENGEDSIVKVLLYNDLKEEQVVEYKVNITKAPETAGSNEKESESIKGGEEISKTEDDIEKADDLGSEDQKKQDSVEKTNLNESNLIQEDKETSKTEDKIIEANDLVSDNKETSNNKKQDIKEYESQHSKKEKTLSKTGKWENHYSKNSIGTTLGALIMLGGLLIAKLRKIIN